MQYGPPKSLNLREAAGQYCPSTHDKHEKKPHEINRGRPELLPSIPPCHLLPQLSDLLPYSINHGKGQDLSPSQLWRRPCGSGTYRELNFFPNVSQNNVPWRRKSYFKPRPTNRVGPSIIPCWHWQWRHVGGQLWNERRRFRLPWVARKVSCNLSRSSKRAENIYIDH